MDYEGRLETLERGHEHAIKNPVCLIQLLCNSPVFRLVSGAVFKAEFVVRLSGGL